MQSMEERQKEALYLSRTFPKETFSKAWRQASYLLWLKWRNSQGEVNMEGQEHTGTEPATTPFEWLRR